MATSGSLGAEERRATIVAALHRDGAIKLDEIATALSVSPMTVRRDLDDLEAEGVLRRVRGGAIPANGPRPFGERRAVRARAKQAIAAKALALMPRDGAVAFDASSTAGTIAAALPAQQDLTIATNSYDNFTALRATSGVSAVLIGGQADEATGSFVGMIACEGAASMVYRRFFASASAVDPINGSSEVSLAESQVKRAFARRSSEIVLCVDSSKLGEQSVAVGFDFAEIAVMITELDPGDERLDPYRALTDVR